MEWQSSLSNPGFRLITSSKGSSDTIPFLFDPDFHNARYARFLEWRKKGVNLQIWTALARELRDWGALRGITDSDIMEQEEQRLESLDYELKRLLHSHPRRDPDLEVAEWSELEPLFAEWALRSLGAYLSEIIEEVIYVVWRKIVTDNGLSPLWKSRYAQCGYDRSTVLPTDRRDV